MKFDDDYIENLKRKLPELPDMKLKRFLIEYKLGEEDIKLLIADKKNANYFEQVISEVDEKKEAGEIEADKIRVIKLAVNYFNTELRKYLFDRQEKISEIKITPENYAELMGIVADGKINSSAAQTVLLEMYETGADPSQVIEEKNLAQVNDNDEIEKVVLAIIENNPQSVEDYKGGKENALKFLMGQVMKETKGKVNPQIAMEIIKKKIV
ncbi:MAG TPA: hypothetical protein ENJ27_01070 [Candidatus Moranbacteria bacterium]|nr:hypothetical protein [Candidatus Moranbacteria bacterium]